MLPEKGTGPQNRVRRTGTAARGRIQRLISLGDSRSELSEGVASDSQRVSDGVASDSPIPDIRDLIQVSWTRVYLIDQSNRSKRACSAPCALPEMSRSPTTSARLCTSSGKS